MKKSILAIAALSLFLSACGDSKIGNLGASVDKGKTDSTDNSETVGTDKKVDVATKSSKNASMPAAVVVAEAVQLLSNQYKSEMTPDQIAQRGQTTLAGLVKKGSTSTEDTFLGAAVVLNAAYTPIEGWPDWMSHRTYATGLHSIGLFSNELVCDLISSVEKKSLSNPNEAMLKMVDRLYELPPAMLEEIWAAKQNVAHKSNIIYNMAGSTPNVQFYSNGKTISGSTMGLSIDGKGVSLFGDGKACGKSVTLSMDTSLSTDITFKNSADRKVSSTTNESVKVDAGVKN